MNDDKRSPDLSLSSPDMDPLEKIILRSMNEGVMTLECSGRLFSANPAALSILGLREEEVGGRHFEEVFGHEPKNKPFTDLFISVTSDSERILHHEVAFTRGDGQVVDLEVTSSCLEFDTCTPGLESVVVVFRDMTAIKSLERMKRRAMNHLSHELKTPLAIILASVERLKQKLEPQQGNSRDLERMERNLRRLTDIQAIVEEVLAPPSFNPVQLSPAEVIEQTVRTLRSKSAHRQVSLTTKLPNLRTRVMDPALISAILETLVKNAIENTPDQGEVLVWAEDSTSGLAVHVRDYGMGIPIADREFIFEGFHHTQATDEYSSKRPFDFNAGGKGLELLRLKVLSEACGFQVSFESGRCKYIPTARDHCPGVISRCGHVQDISGCMESGGTEFSVRFPNAG